MDGAKSSAHNDRKRINIPSEGYITVIREPSRSEIASEENRRLFNKVRDKIRDKYGPVLWKELEKHSPELLRNVQGLKELATTWNEAGAQYIRGLIENGNFDELEKHNFTPIHRDVFNEMAEKKARINELKKLYQKESIPEEPNTPENRAHQASNESQKLKHGWKRNLSQKEIADILGYTARTVRKKMETVPSWKENIKKDEENPPKYKIKNAMIPHLKRK